MQPGGDGSVRGFLKLAVVVVLVAAAAVAPPIVRPSGATVGNTVTTSVISGANRYDTARLAALAAFPAGATDAVLASGQNFPDGLAAATLAGALGAPLLLTPSAALDPDTRSALSALKVKTVHVVGGTTAVSANVISQLTAAGYTVPPAISGADRYATAAAVATAAAGIKPVGAIGGLKAAILATGLNFPDALAAGPAAYFGHLPILLTDPNTLSPSASSAITSLGLGGVIIMGGINAVSSAVEAAVQTLTVNGTAVATARINGPTRFATATAMDDLIVTPVAGGGLGMSAQNVVLASGLNFPDALVGAELVSPIVLDDPLPPATVAWLTANGPAISNIEGLGGPNVVPPIDLAAAQAAASVFPRSATITAVAGGVSFTVTFAGPVLPPAAANFTINGGAAGAGVSAVWPGPTPTSYVVQTTNVINAGDVIAVNASAPPTFVAGAPVAATSTTVATSAPPALTGALFYVGGNAVALQFSKPVSTTSLASGLTLTSSAGAVLDTTAAHWTLSADSTTVTIPVTTHAIGSGDKLALAATIVDLTPGTALALADPTALTALATPAAPTVESAQVGSTANAPGSTTFSHTSDASGTGPLPMGDSIVVQARPGSPADGVNGAQYKLQFGAPGSGSTVQVASAVSSGVTTLTITVPSAAGDYTSGAALATALNGSAVFGPLFIATGSGTTDLHTTVANTAAQVVTGGSSTSTVFVTFSASLVPPSGAFPATIAGSVEDLAKYSVSTGAVVTAAYPLDSWAGPSVVQLSVTATTAAQSLVTGTTTVTFGGTAHDFGGNALATPATVTTS
jgi:putative cell wall-binding protein